MSTSQACCTLKPVQHDYSAAGKYETIAGVKTYVVGPENSSKLIIHVYDIFGDKPQTIQGADRLSSHTGAIVLVPDFFDGSGLPGDTIPMDTDEKKATAQKFFSTVAEPQANLAKLLAIRRAIPEKFPSAEGHVGVFGLCWGGKISVLACGEGNEGQGRRFNASGTAHPGLMDKKDAEAQTAPHLLLASKDEPADIVEAYKTAMGDRAEITTYGTMHHGWMGARADLKDEKNVEEFKRGYEQAGAFFSKHL